MYDWHSFAYQGDECLINFACATPYTPSVNIFIIGHALELYLKAVYAKKFVDINVAIKFGHKIKDLWDKCKQKDPLFLPNYEIRSNIYSKDFFDSNSLSTLAKDDQMHFLKNRNLYIIAKHLKDLKYFGLPWKPARSKGVAIGSIQCDPYWISLFSEIRKYLKYPQPGKADLIEQLLSTEKIPSANAQSFLRGILNNT